jgi:hypothetical protein
MWQVFRIANIVRARTWLCVRAEEHRGDARHRLSGALAYHRRGARRCVFRRGADGGDDGGRGVWQPSCGWQVGNRRLSAGSVMRYALRVRRTTIIKVTIRATQKDMPKSRTNAFLHTVRMIVPLIG